MTLLIHHLVLNFSSVVCLPSSNVVLLARAGHSYQLCAQHVLFVNYFGRRLGSFQFGDIFHDQFKFRTVNCKFSF